MIITPSTTLVTNEDIELAIKASDKHSGVKSITLPNGEVIFSEEAIYTVKENGVFEFVVEDNAGNSITETIEINNINKYLAFSSPRIEQFEDIHISNQPKTYTTNIKGFIVEDWRNNPDDWRIEVQASPLRHKNELYELPSGSLSMKNITNINLVKGKGQMPYAAYDGAKIIDRGYITILNGSNTNGEYSIEFDNNALELTIDPSTAKVGTYETTITWSLVTAP